MPTAVKISNELFEKAKIQSKVFKRSIAGQIEYWAKIGQIIEENPDLPLPFILSVKTTAYGGGGVWGRRSHTFSETVSPLSQYQ